MDKWKYYDITHKHHVLCNPMSEEKLDRFCHLLKLPRGYRVLDIACGKGEVLVGLAEKYGISGVGVDLSPFCIKDCKDKHLERVPDTELVFIEMDGAKYQPISGEQFDVSMCLGASWVFENHVGTLQALKHMTKSGGLVIVGEPFWLKEPTTEYLEATSMTRESFRSHEENVSLGEEMGLTCLYTIVSNKDDWDHYETLQWWAVDDYIKSHRDDPDNKELLDRIRKAKEIYLKWGRDTLSWAIYIFRNP
ncbi:MAG: class I SAM-dependent methyltransferase [Candidatus Thorarchaeota archaeon]|nr:class I SAM-dependent methyltransferase [Candidatus Thorarchaeota archaeon]